MKSSPTDDIPGHVAAISRFLTFTFTEWFRGSVKRGGRLLPPRPRAAAAYSRPPPSKRYGEI